jgi:hypothetical protein
MSEIIIKCLDKDVPRLVYHLLKENYKPWNYDEYLSGIPYENRYDFLLVEKECTVPNAEYTYGGGGDIVVILYSNKITEWDRQTNFNFKRHDYKNIPVFDFQKMLRRKKLERIICSK